MLCFIGSDSNSENHPNNDYPEELSSENDGEENSFESEQNIENNLKKSDEEDAFYLEEDESEFYEKFKKKLFVFTKLSFF